MKTRQEIQDEISELYGAGNALVEAMSKIQILYEENTRKMFALNHMLKEMEEGGKE